MSDANGDEVTAEERPGKPPLTVLDYAVPTSLLGARAMPPPLPSVPPTRSPALPVAYPVSDPQAPLTIQLASFVVIPLVVAAALLTFLYLGFVRRF